MVEYTKLGTLEVTYSDGIKQRFVIDAGGSSNPFMLDSVIVHHKHTAKYL